MNHSDDYLWDGSGEPDPEIQKLENVLGKLRHNRPAPAFPAATLQPPARRLRLWRPALFPVAAVVAAILAITAVTTFVVRQSRHASGSSVAGWDVTRVSGAPRVGSQTLESNHAKGKLVSGEVLETDGRSQANIRLEELGEIVVDPDTRLRLPESNQGLKRLALDRGTIHASIWAPAGEFAIDTPSAVAVDLGCAYTLHVDDSGNGVLHTTLGWVGFKLDGHESFIPAGAACSTHRKTGPGTPYFEDASASLRSALSRFDLESSTPEEKSAALHAILGQSRHHDSLTLWHLLSRVPDQDRGLVYDRLSQLVPPPANVTRKGVLALDQAMLDLWWNQLGFGDVSLWRHWERTWKDSR